MKLVLNILVIICGICGIAVSLIGDITATSAMASIDGVELSSWLVIISIIVFITGAFNLVSSN